MYHFYLKKLKIALCFLVLLSLSFSTSAQSPNADFNANITSGCAPLLAQFNDLSTGNIVAWSWDLSVSTATVQNPAAAYTMGGTYTICLTVTDANGATDTECKTAYINVFSNPSVDFTASNTVGCTPLAVQFQDMTTQGSTSLTDWEWNFGDGNTSTLQNPSHTYTTSGNYNISLTVTDANGCERTFTRNSYISVGGTPTASFTTTDTFNCAAPFTTTFNSTTPSTGNPLSYNWNFGDLTTSTLQNPTHTYSDTGQYDVQLIVFETNSGCADTIIKNNHITINSPLDFTYSASQGCGNTTIAFVDVSPDATANWLWDFGDGNTSTLQNPSHTYTTTGCFTVTFTADVDGCTSTVISDTCIIIYPLPGANYTTTGALNSCTLPHSVSFAGTSNDAASWFWDFGDGNTSTAQNPSHTYTTFGVFPVALTVTSPDGCDSTIIADTIRVQEVDVDFSAVPRDGCEDLTVNFSENVFSLFPITSYTWDFGGVGTSNLPNPTFTFPDTGNYHIQLIAVNSQGCADTLTRFNYIRVGTPPSISFLANITAPCVGADVVFTNTSSSFVDTWIWDFGDGTTSGATNPTHSYNGSDTFDVTLTGVHKGCSTTVTLSDYINVLQPRAYFGFNQDCNTPFDVDFLDSSSQAHRWFWDFGDATLTTDTTSVQNPSFTYSQTGTYEVSLTAFNDSTGCSHTRTRFVNIAVPVASFIAPDTLDCAPLTIQVANTSQDAAAFMWTATGGIISNDTAAAPTISYNNQGIYTDIQLTVTDINGCTSVANFLDSVRVSDVTPIFAPDVNGGCSPLTVNFTDASTSFIGNIVSWRWSFGDDSTSTLQNPTHLYPNNGSYNVQLAVTNNLGCSDSIVIASPILVTNPTAAFTIADTSFCAGQGITFTNTSSGVGMSFAWDFGDGATSSDTSPVHIFATQGIYNVCLTVTDINGCTDIICQEVAAFIPVANFVGDTLITDCLDLTVQFTNQSSHGESYLWDFGDGSTSNAENPSHLYTDPGHYDVTLIVTRADGCTDTLVRPAYIQVNGPAASFTYSPLSGCPTLDVAFEVTGQNITSYSWLYGDGVLETFTGTGGFDTLTMTHSYPSGSYIPTLFVESSPTCQLAYIPDSSIDVHILEVDFMMSDSIVCDTGTVFFMPIINASIPIDSLEWTFSGLTPNTSSDSLTSAFYDVPGVYTVTLTIGDSLCVRSISKNITVAPSPQAGFSITPPVGCNPQDAAFTDNSTIALGGAITQWDWNFGTGDTSDVQNPTYTYNTVNAYTIDLMVTSNFGCIDTSSQTYVVNPTPVADAGMGGAICRNDSLQLQASGGTTYSWTPNISLSCSNCPNPQAFPQTTTTYTVTVGNAAGCSSTDTVRVEVHPFDLPVVGVTNDTTICAGDVVQLFATGSVSPLDFTWGTNQPGLSCYIGCSNPFATPTVTTTYYVTLTNSVGCTDTDSVTVTVIDPFSDIVGPDETICQGENIQLNATLGTNHQWSPSSGLSCVFCPNPIADPTTSTTYVVSATNINGCIIRDSITINVLDPGIITAGDDQVVCPGQPIQLNAITVGTFSWTPDPTLSDPTITNPTVTPTQTTTYYLTVDNGSCIVFDSVTVFVQTSTDITGGEATICEGDSVALSLIGLAQTYTWTPAESLNDPTSATPIASPTQTTNYTVIAEITGCASDTAEFLVNVVQRPEINGFPIQQVFPGSSFQLGLDVEVSPAYTYTWTPATDLTCIDCPNPLAVANTDSITYTVTISTSFGCNATDSVQILFVNDCSEDLIVVPNAFTPNGDGLNDILYVRGTSLLDIRIFRIFSRNGDLVFESNTMSKGWDGTFQGKPVNGDVFVYYVEAPCPATGNLIQKKGNVTIIR